MWLQIISLFRLISIFSFVVRVEALSGACMLVKRQAIQDVGLWDESYFLHCGDLDCCKRRIIQRGRVASVGEIGLVLDKIML